MISEKIKGWLKNKPLKKKKEDKVEVVKKVSVDDFKEEKKEFKMAPEVKAEVREQDIVKRDGDGNKVPSYL